MTNGEKKQLVVTTEMAGLLVVLVETAFRLAPIIAEGISNMSLPEQTKEEYIGRIRIAQESLKPWE